MQKSSQAHREGPGVTRKLATRALDPRPGPRSNDATDFHQPWRPPVLLGRRIGRNGRMTPCSRRTGIRIWTESMARSLGDESAFGTRNVLQKIPRKSSLRWHSTSWIAWEEALVPETWAQDPARHGMPRHGPLFSIRAEALFWGVVVPPAVNVLSLPCY